MKIIMITIKTTRAATIKKKVMTHMIIISINKTLAYVNQNYFIFSNAQSVINVVIDDDDNMYNNLINEDEGVDHAKITLAKTLIAFELTRVNS